MMNDVQAPDNQTLVESFGHWARDEHVDRFWGVASTGDGRAVLLLPTAGAPEYRAVLAPARGRVYLVMGRQADGYENVEFEVGPADESPRVLLDTAAVWLLEMAQFSLSKGDTELAIEASHLAWRLFHYLGNIEQSSAALKLKLQSIG